jgi:hypothetical protein
MGVYRRDDRRRNSTDALSYYHMTTHLFGTVGGQVVFTDADTEHEAWMNARSEGFHPSELRYYGELEQYTNKVQFDGTVVTV